MLLTTTNQIGGKKIREYRGIVFGEVTNGINYQRDIMASFTSVVGGRSAEYEEEIINTRADAINEMIARAEKIGANAVIGIKIDYETINSMLMVVASGTAVVVE